MADSDSPARTLRGDELKDPVAYVLLAFMLVAGVCFLWAAVDALRHRRALWMDGDEIDPRSGFVRRREDPVRYWVWVVIYAGMGGILAGLPLIVAYNDLIGSG
jgi:hypothetical protein